jgi:hypothetical protein
MEGFVNLPGLVGANSQIQEEEMALLRQQMPLHHESIAHGKTAWKRG